MKETGLERDRERKGKKDRQREQRIGENGLGKSDQGGKLPEDDTYQKAPFFVVSLQQKIKADKI